MRLRTITARRYVTPLREGGSLPAIIEGDDDGLYVLKFRGAGQGAKALIAELLPGEIGRPAGLPFPDIVRADSPRSTHSPCSRILSCSSTRASSPKWMRKCPHGSHRTNWRIS